MIHRHCSLVLGKLFTRCSAITLLVAVLSGASTSQAAVPNAVPAEFQGTWVPSNATCQSSVRVLVAGDRLTLANGNDSAVLGGIEMAGPAYFPPDYRGINAVLITEFDGHQPVIATFNVGEKKGTAQMDFAAVTPGKANAQLNAYYAKLNLAKRFPLNKMLLKKCVGG